MFAAALLVLVAQAPPSTFQPTPPMREAASEWVAYAAETKIERAGAPDQFGRFLQDEHGCSRHDMVEKDGTAQIVITNHEIGRSYSMFRGVWSASPIRLVPGIPFPRRPPQSFGRVVRKVEPIGGFEVFETEVPVRSPRGDSTMTQWVIPALNFLVARRAGPTGSLETVTSIRLGPQRAEDFQPPPGAAVREGTEFRGGTFLAVVVRIEFANQRPIELTTTENRQVPLKMPNGDTLGLKTLVVDLDRNLVRVTLAPLSIGGPPPAQSAELGTVDVALGKTAELVNGVENFKITVTRIADRFAR